MRVLELYSGIGGMHVAFQGSSLDYDVLAAMEINDTANKVYKHNFPNTPVFNRVIESLTVDYLIELNADVWSLSPPCQPFTRLGKRQCESDNRNASFLHVLNLIKVVKPKGILLENVKGFELSEPWCRLIKVLDDSGYDYRQFLLSPLQFGIPNCRLRFYLIAHLKSSSFAFLFDNPKICGQNSNLDNIYRKPPEIPFVLPNCKCINCLEIVKHIQNPDDNFTEYVPLCHPISNFIISTQENQDSVFRFLDEESLVRYFEIIDIVRPCDKKTRCFTKGYSKRFEGTGSILQTGAQSEAIDNIIAYRRTHMNDKEALLEHAKSLKLRFFHSKEVANFLCFPNWFDFPDHVNEKQRLRLLGNSINVLVVSHLIYWSFQVK